MADNNLPVLVVEDDPSLREAICDTLALAGRSFVAVGGGGAALSELEKQAFALVLSDVRMIPMSGIELLKEIRVRLPNLPVLLMTAYAEVDKAVDAMRSGACDFLLKPFEPSALLGHISKYELDKAGDVDGFIALDQVSRDLFTIAQRVAKTDATVLLTGESGVGKEVVARYIHRYSARTKGPFVAINCAAIPDTLLEATLFGYEKGAFTGAQQAQAGKFEQAEKGTLLLDEVTEMPLGLQAKLLRVLQEREVERVGGKKPIPLDIRIVATSNRNLADAVAKGVFREDLFYRLNVFPVAIPALRHRKGDILAIAQHFVAEHAGRMGRSTVAFSPEAISAMMQYDWPGNVRELENVVQRALILCAGNLIELNDLRINASQFSALATQRAEPQGGLQLSSDTPEKRADNMRDVEREHILRTLADVGGSRKLAIERLGISERTLRYKLQQYRDEGFYNE